MNELSSPNFDRLLDWLDGRLTEAEAQQLAQELAGADEATQADLDWLRSFHRMSQAVRQNSPPPALIETLKRRFAAAAERQQPPGIFQRLLAHLTFDSLTQPALGGARSAATEGNQRQLIYSTDSAEVALNIQPRSHDQRLDLAGQVFPADALSGEMFSLQLLRDGVEAGLTTTDELGEFNFADLPPGEYELVLSAHRLEVIILAVPLRA